MEKLVQLKEVPESLYIQDSIDQPSHPFIQKLKPTIFSNENNTYGIDIGFRPDLDQLLLQIQSQSGIVVLESVTTLFLGSPTAKVYQFLHKLFQQPRNCKIVLIYHSDISLSLDFDIKSVLESYCVGHLILYKGDTTLNVDYLVKKKSGKVFKESMAYESKDGLRVFPIPSPFAHIPVAPLPAETKPKESGLEGVSFKLDLTEKERSQREGLVLPYMDAQKVIEYTYEEDEFDDEDDPDEDLDI